MDKYEKEEFLIDADMEFYKVKKLLDKNPRLLRDDPVLSIDYHKIISLIRQKKLVENTSDHFDATNAYKATWQDPQDPERLTQFKLNVDLAKHRRMQRSGDGSGSAAAAEESDLALQ